MKTHRHLFEEIIKDDNLELAIKEACKSRKKSHKKKTRLERLKTDPDRIKKVKDWILNYSPMRRRPHEIYDGIARKKRQIYVPSVRETVVQHAVIQVLNRHLMNGVYEHMRMSAVRQLWHKKRTRTG